jgi:hypothetical protein
MKTPYFAQWESRDLVTSFLSGACGTDSDPLWQMSGATTAAEYAFWARHLCGMACLQMVLAARTGEKIPIAVLAKNCMNYGGYRLMEDDTIKGLIYQPFVAYVKEAFALDAEVRVDFPVDKIGDVVAGDAYFMASVHPSIRTPEIEPPSKGGHLVLLFANTDAPGKLTFHNPSGLDVATQENVVMDAMAFDRFYAGRGIFIR